MSAIRERVDAAVPELRKRKDQIAALAGFSLKMPGNEAAALAAVRETILEHLAAGTPVPADVAEPILKAKRLDELHLLRNRAMNEVKSFLGEESASLRDRSSDSVFGALRVELARVATEVATLTPILRGARKPEDLIALDGDALEAWKKLEALAEEYEEIRSIQDEAFIIKKSDGPRGDIKRLRDIGYFADAIDLVPYWQRERSLAANASTIRKGDHYSWLRAGQVRDDPAGLAQAPTEETVNAWRTRIIPHATRAGTVTHLIWACTEAQPWVPSLDDYLAASEHAHVATIPGDETRIDHPGRQLAALASYYSVTGGTPPAGTPIVRAKPVSRAGGSLAVSRIRRRPPSLHDEPLARTSTGGQVRASQDEGIGSPY